MAKWLTVLILFFGYLLIRSNKYLPVINSNSVINYNSIRLS